MAAEGLSPRERDPVEQPTSAAELRITEQSAQVKITALAELILVLAIAGLMIACGRRAASPSGTAKERTANEGSAGKGAAQDN